MTKVLLHVYPSLGPPEEMASRRPIGRDNESYQLMLEGLVELAQAADDLGYWGLSHTEHHLHSEGLEISPAPLMLNLFLGQHTKRLHHGQLGLVLPAHDPIRLAAEIAVADHMLKGRLFVGVARGSESRWTNILCQKMGVTATSADHGEAEERNWLLFAENFRILKMAWGQDLLAYDGPTYKIPYPFEGIEPWPPGDTTASFGVPGEVDASGTVKGVSVVPRPYTTPHPKLFQAFDAGESAIRWCAEESVVPTLIGPTQRVASQMRVFADAAATNGSRPAFGANVGICRTFHILENGATDESARTELLRRADKYEAPVWSGWFGPLGLADAVLRMPGEKGSRSATGESISERLLRSGMLIGGTVDMVKRQVESLLEELPAEYLVWLLHWGILPRDEALRTLELFATEVMPEFDLEVPGAPASA